MLSKKSPAPVADDSQKAWACSTGRAARALLLLVHLLCAHCLLAGRYAQITRFRPDETGDHNACPKYHCQHHKRHAEPHDEQRSAYHHRYQQARRTRA